MTIRKKLLIYYGVFLAISYGIAAILTGVLISSGLNRLLYRNIADLNHNIVNALEDSNSQDFSSTLADAISFTGVDLIVYYNDQLYYSSFATSNLEIEKATKVSNTYDVYRIIDDFKYYYFTHSDVDDGTYQVYVFRAEGSLMGDTQTIFMMSFIGIVFLVISISIISIFSARTFAYPAQLLANYVDNLSFQDKPTRRPRFDILEYEELSKALENAHMRVYEYSLSEKEFLHNFSHEMKTPLTNIYSYAEALYYGVLNQNEIKNTSSIIMHESEKLKDFINQVLYLGRLDSIGETLNISKVNLVNLIADSLNTIEFPARDKGIQLVFNHELEDVYLYADSDKLEVAITNLIHNALRYAKTKIRITLSQDKDQTIILVDDDGIGIDDEAKHQIWDRYYIGKEGHTGLGLTITKSIIEKHRGQIIAGNNELGGASFKVVFLANRKVVVTL